MSDPMTPERIAEIKARCDAATPGPWFTVFRTCFTSVSTSDTAIGKDGPIVAQAYCGQTNRKVLRNSKRHLIDANNEFIAHSRTDIPDLIDHIKHQDAIIDQLRERLDRAKRIPSI